MGSDMDNLGLRPSEVFLGVERSWRRRPWKTVNTLVTLAMRKMEDRVTGVESSWVVVLSLTLPFPHQKSSSPAAAPRKEGGEEWEWMMEMAMVSFDVAA